MLTSADVEALLGGDFKSLAKTAELRAFIQDTAAALRRYEAEIRALQSDISRMSAQRKVSHGPLATAVDALSALSAEEQRQVLDVWVLSLVAGLNEEAARGRTHTLAATSALARARHALGVVMDHPRAGEEVKQAAAQAFESLPDLSMPAEISIDLSERPSRGVIVAPREESAGNLADLFDEDDEPVVGEPAAAEQFATGTTLDPLPVDEALEREELRQVQQEDFEETFTETLEESLGQTLEESLGQMPGQEPGETGWREADSNLDQVPRETDQGTVKGEEPSAAFSMRAPSSTDSNRARLLAAASKLRAAYEQGEPPSPKEQEAEAAKSVPDESSAEVKPVAKSVSIDDLF